MSDQTDRARVVETIEAILRAGLSVRFRADGWSMHPTIRDGEFMTVAPLGHSLVRTGEIVLYRRGRAVIAHRVIRVQQAASPSPGFVLQGDGAHACDQPIERPEMLGRVVAVERNGRTLQIDVVNALWCRVRGHAVRAVRQARTAVARIVMVCPIKLHRVL